MERKGVSCWRDKDSEGFGKWAEKIVSALKSVSTMVLIFSSKSQSSDNVEKELSLAAKYNLSIIPIKIENVEPTGVFEYHFATPNVINVIGDRSKERFDHIAQHIWEHVERLRPTEAKVAFPDSNVNEEKYLNELRRTLEDGQISDKERGRLEGTADILNISPERAKELEEQVKNELVQEPFEDEDEESQETADRAYWEGRASKTTLEMADHMLDLLKSFDSRLTLNYRRRAIGLLLHSRVNNFVYFIPKKQWLRISVRAAHSDEMETKIKAEGLDYMGYNNKKGKYKIRLAKGDVKQHEAVLKELLKASYEQASK